MRHWDRVAESLRAAAGASPELLKALAPGSDPNGLARDFAAKLFCAFKTVPDVAANTSKLRGAPLCSMQAADKTLQEKLDKKTLDDLKADVSSLVQRLLGDDYSAPLDL
jgi:hypothetical protein